MELNAKNLGLSGGILWGVSLMLMTLASIYTGYGTMVLDIIANVYPGYEITPVGSLIGLGWGFLDGFIGLYLLAWIYNKLNG